MARKARDKSDLGIYMVYLKSVEGVAFDALDKTNFLNILVQNNTFLLGYTLLNNAFLFVVKETENPLDVIIRTQTIKFAKWYNKLHNRSGKIFDGRYASYPAHTMEDVWQLIVNVHSVAEVNSEAMSSSQDYFANQFVKTGYPLNFFKTKSAFLEHCNQLKQNKQAIKMTDQEVTNYIINTFNIKPENLKNMPKGFMNKALSQIFSVTKASVRQIARISTLPLRMLWSLAKSLKPHTHTDVQKVANGKEKID